MGPGTGTRSWLGTICLVGPSASPSRRRRRAGSAEAAFASQPTKEINRNRSRMQLAPNREGNKTYDCLENGRQE